MKYILVFVLHLLKGLAIARLTQVTLTVYQNGAHYSRIKSLIIYPWRLIIQKKFKTALK
jgi:hypothetical protein